jgi:hypothetical protein
MTDEKQHVTLHDRVTGETKTIVVPSYLEAGEEPSTFWWDMGNGSCDCNRGSYFYWDCPSADIPRDAEGRPHFSCLGDRFDVVRLEESGWLLIEDGEALDAPRRLERS